MKYPFMTIEKDGTEITYSEPDIYNNIKVYLERWNPKEDHFNDMTIEIPNGTLISNHGYTKEEEIYHIDKMKQLANVIYMDFVDHNKTNEIFSAIDALHDKIAEL